MRVAIEEVEALAKRAILRFGYTEDEARVILDVLMYAQLRGNNQGIVKLIGPGIPKTATRAIAVEKETAVSALIDGGTNHAMLVVNHAVDVALRKAGEAGIGLVGVHHLNTSSGAIGYYARRIADRGMIGLIFAGASPAVAIEGSYEPLFGTNPLAIAIPTGSNPVVLDLATAAMSKFGVIEAKTAGRDLPPKTAYDQEGRPTTNPAEALKGALRTFDAGPKSSGLSFMIEALTGPLIGASFAGMGDVKGNWAGHIVIAIDPSLFSGSETLREGMNAMVEKVKGSKRLPGVDEILLPGERGDRMTESSRSGGEMAIEDNLYLELKKAGGYS